MYICCSHPHGDFSKVSKNWHKYCPRYKKIRVFIKYQTEIDHENQKNEPHTVKLEKIATNYNKLKQNVQD